MATPIPANRASFTLTEIAHVTGGRIVGPGQGAVCGVVTDSRRVTPGSLFVALQGEHHDAHRFLPQVAEAGAAAALVMPGRAVAAPTVAIEVPDTLAALGSLAAHHRRAWGGTVVAITGSAGKTTTKELTAAALAATGLSVARTVGNLNNRIGVPMTLLALDASSELAVVEMGTSAPGEIATLAVMTDPQVGVVTTVAVAHSEGLGSLAGVAQEKLSLLAALGRHGVAVYGIDSEPLRRYGQSAPIERAWSFGRAVEARSRLVAHELDGQLRNRCRYLVGGHACDVTMAMLGEGPAVDGAAALAVVAAIAGEGALEAALQAACQGLASVPAVAGRLSPVPGPNGALVIDDSYNANPASMQASLATLAQTARARGGRALAVLGDMKELGGAEADEHRAVGRQAAQLQLARLVLCGEAMAVAADSAGQVPCVRVADPLAAVEALGPLGEHDVVLIKGSRSMAMERLVGALQASGSASGSASGQASGTCP